MPPKDWISETQSIEPIPTTVFTVDMEARQLINTVTERLQVTDYRISNCEWMIASSSNYSNSIRELEGRISMLEQVVWRLQNYIENWVDE